MKTSNDFIDMSEQKLKVILAKILWWKKGPARGSKENVNYERNQVF